MSPDSQEWFVTERARALAMIHLTRRDDLIVKKPAEGTGLEFMVYLSGKKGEPAVRQFGVALRGTKSTVTEAHMDYALRSTLQSFLRAGPFPYPVCLFHFTMDGDQGYYTWVAEPAVAGGRPQLLLHEAPHVRKLDRAALDEIVAAVSRWYDAFLEQVAVKAS
jgi:hypothetical protein